MKKNDRYEAAITDMGNDGVGIGHVEAEEGGSFTLFVKDTVPGDTCIARITKVKKSYAYARLEELVTPGEDRVQPICANASRCGGCSMMQLAYPAQLRLKQKKVEDCLTRIGKIAPERIPQIMEPPFGMDYPFFYRNKMQFPLGISREGEVKIGFYAGHTHSIIDLERCPIGHPLNEYLIRHVRPALQVLADEDPYIIYHEEEHKGLLRHMLVRIGFATGDVMVCFVINGRTREVSGRIKGVLCNALSRAVQEYNSHCEIYRSMQRAFSKKADAQEDIQLEEGPVAGWEHVNAKGLLAGGSDARVKLVSVTMNENRERTNRILGNTTAVVLGTDRIRDVLCGKMYGISAGSFYQVNPVVTEALYHQVEEYAALGKEEIVWDLYCGIGTITLTLAPEAKMAIGVEVVPQAVENAVVNTRENGVKNAEFFCGKAEQIARELYEEHPELRANVVIVDPPRKGCDEALISTMAAMAPERIVYVSCDPSTFARDVKLLEERGYKLKKARMFDQFCHSTHTEVVSILSNAGNYDREYNCK